VARSGTIRRFALAGALVAAGTLLSGCSMADLPRFGWPEGVTAQGKHMQYFWSGAFIAALVVGVIVWAAMFWAFIAYRKRSGGPLYPKQTKENLPFELACTALPFVLVAILFYFTVTTENKVLANVPNPDVKIDVTPYKWAWDFGHEGTTVPGALRNTGSDKDWYNSTEVHTIGSSEEVAVLVVPSHKVIEFHLQSRDVIHSFWVPDFLFKRDVFPDPEANETENHYQVTIDKEGAFVGRCAELCGTYHSAMNFEVRALPFDLYTAYLTARQSIDPQTKAPYTAAAALAKVGADNPTCGTLCSPHAITTYPFATNRQAKAPSENPNGGS
jgi:cytochrome c oxidase subunit 2